MLIKPKIGRERMMQCCVRSKRRRPLAAPPRRSSSPPALLLLLVLIPSGCWWAGGRVRAPSCHPRVPPWLGILGSLSPKAQLGLTAAVPMLGMRLMEQSPEIPTHLGLLPSRLDHKENPKPREKEEREPPQHLCKAPQSLGCFRGVAVPTIASPNVFKVYA